MKWCIQGELSVVSFLAALLAACLLGGGLGGCTRTPEDHLHVAKENHSAVQRALSVEALAKADNQAMLLDIAFNSLYENTRTLAAGKLTDQELLVSLTKNTRDWSPVFAAMMGNISDSQQLMDLARTAVHPRARIQAGLVLIRNYSAKPGGQVKTGQSSRS